MPDPLYPATVDLDPAWTADTLAVQAGRPARVPGAPMNPPITMSSTYVHDASARVRPRRQRRLGGARDGARRARRRPRGDVRVRTRGDHRDRRPGSGRRQRRALDGDVLRRPEHLRADARRHGASTSGWPRPTTRTPSLRQPTGADMVWVESIANPLMVVADVPAIAAGARERGASRRGRCDVRDAAPPAAAAPRRGHRHAFGDEAHRRPLRPAARCGRLPGRRRHAATLAQHRHDHGAIPGGLEAFLALRGLRTLAVRLDRSEASAVELARRLAAHPRRLARPLPRPAGRPAARTRVAGAPARIGTDAVVRCRGDRRSRPTHSSRDLRLITHATSLGGVESLIERRARYAGDAALVGPTLCRLSVGIEDVEDLWADLDGALRSAFA